MLRTRGGGSLASYCSSSIPRLPDQRGLRQSSGPKEPKSARDAGQSTLTVFLHPRCFCSRATVHELERLLAGRKLPCEPWLSCSAQHKVPPDGSKVRCWNGAAVLMASKSKSTKRATKHDASASRLLDMFAFMVSTDVCNSPAGSHSLAVTREKTEVLRQSNGC